MEIDFTNIDRRAIIEDLAEAACSSVDMKTLLQHYYDDIYNYYLGVSGYELVESIVDILQLDEDNLQSKLEETY